MPECLVNPERTLYICWPFSSSDSSTPPDMAAKPVTSDVFII